MLTANEIRLILATLTAQYGFGYSGIPEVARLQAKLSIMLEVAERREVGTLEVI